MKKIILILILIIGNAFFSNLVLAQKEDERCEKLKEEIRDIINERKTCETNEECFLDENSNVWPFLCFFIRSHVCDDGEYLTLLEKKIEEYNNKCQKYISDCDVNDLKHLAITCGQGKCVDVFGREDMKGLWKKDGGEICSDSSECGPRMECVADLTQEQIKLRLQGIDIETIGKCRSTYPDELYYTVENGWVKGY